ncbi:TetR family transcriptional regulator [Microlunatus soli]|uniref:Regulatory protein, tetR family n=1 Tax=Microlunatus soli TaxID=630515 RepID=A0A1H1UK51_9ACTN|nr:TetR family transcriptional regulator [Microlunatus soli]SDS72887.1 regulatory protein, tetR family [Microlunatus soli]
MERDAEATRRRLLLAARDEFSHYGVAGARVDRIAAAARASKAQIYHYFGSKKALFDAVIATVIAEGVDDLPTEPEDLPQYAGRLHDWYRERPWVQRLAMWQRLERGPDDCGLLGAIITAHAGMAGSIARAQDGGLTSGRFSAEELSALVVHLSTLWSTAPPADDPTAHETRSAKRQRDMIVRAVAALMVPPH